MAAPAILAEQLTRTFRSLHAVDNVDLAVAPGMIYGVLGPMGAGKTTLVRLLLGLLAPTSGTAYMLGYDVRTQADAIRARTGVVLQAAGLYDDFTALENLELYARIWHLPAPDRDNRIELLLHHFDLWSRRHERVGNWSLGMKHELAIARALVHRPALLILDEPALGLDTPARDALHYELAGLVRNEGATILLTSKDAAEVAVLCDEVAVMDHGRIVAAGTPASLARHDGATQMRIQGNGFTEDLIRLIESRRDVLHAHSLHDSLLVEVTHDAACAAVVNLVVESGADIVTVERSNGGLDAAYRALLGGVV